MAAGKSSRINRQYKTKYRIRNWREYERGLRSRGDVTIWLSEDAKYGFGRLIDLARAEPVAVAKHGRPVVAVMAVEEYERLKFFKTGHVDSRLSTTGKAE